MADDNKTLSATERLEALEAKQSEQDEKITSLEGENASLRDKNEKLETDLKAATDLIDENASSSSGTATSSGSSQSSTSTVPSGSTSEKEPEKPAAAAPEASASPIDMDELKAAIAEGNAALKDELSKENAALKEELAAVKDLATKASIETGKTKQPGREDSAVDVEGNVSGTDGDPNANPGVKSYAEAFESNAAINPAGLTFAEAIDAGTTDSIRALTAMEAVNGSVEAYNKKNNIEGDDPTSNKKATAPSAA